MGDIAYKPIGQVKKFDIIKDSFDYFLREVGKFKSFENSDTNAGGTTIYTVPVGKIFYLISAQLFYRTGAVAPTSSTAEIRINTMPFLMLDPPDVAQIVFAIVSNPSIPIKLNAGEKIKVKSDDNNLFARGTLSGYEVLAKDSQNFLR